MKIFYFRLILFSKGVTMDIKPWYFTGYRFEYVVLGSIWSQVKGTTLAPKIHNENIELRLTIVTGGSKSLSPGTSIHDISIAPSLPGEQGDNKSCSMTLGSFLDGPLTFLKCVAVWTLRTGCINASRTTMLISAPEYLLKRTCNKH